MPDSRSLKLDLTALALLALTVFFALALYSYDPADPPSTLVFPSRERAHNVCGPFGAMTATWLLSAVGVGAYYLVASLAVFDGLLLSQRVLTAPLLRAAGWVVSLFGLVTLVAMLWPEASPGPVIGSGGYLGAAGRGLLEAHFASVGAYILLLSLIVGGTLLATDYAIVHLVTRVLRIIVRTLAVTVFILVAAVTSRRSTSKRRRVKGDLDGEGPAVKRPDRLVLKISGKQVETAAEDEEVEDDEEGDKEAEDEAGQSTEGGAETDEPPPPPLRIKPRGAKADREALLREIEAATRGPDAADYTLPPVDLLVESEVVQSDEHEKEVRRKAKILEKTFASFGFSVKVVEIETGPVIAQYEVELEAGLRLSKITSLADDVAIALRVPSVRIVAPIPGKNTVGIEVPNATRQLVRLREVVEEGMAQAAKMRIPIYLGKDVSGNPMLVDLTTLPHLLIAGRTGTGKSVCLNTIIMSMLMARRPDEVRMLLIDPKMVELSPYMKLPHLMHPVVTDMKKAEAILAWAVDKMEERYALLARAGVRHIGVYNQLGEEELMDRLQPDSDEERAAIPTNLPYIVIVADEMADLMMTAAKEVETHIIRLAQKSRAVGIHLVLATQKPTVDVITGLIKSNLPARISFQVASRTDSRVVLDEMGADKLLGNGDLLFLWPGTSTLLRGQGAYVSDEEINKVVSFVGTTEPQFVKELVQLPVGNAEEQGIDVLRQRDELYEAAIDVVVREGRGSVSLLQRALGIGYGRAARLIDFMAEDGIVGQYNGSQARDVLITPEQWAQMSGQQPAAEPPKPTRKKVISVGSRPADAMDDETGEDEVESEQDEEEEVDSDEESGEDESDEDEDNDDGDEPPFDADDEGDDDDNDDEEEPKAPPPPKYRTRRYRTEKA